MKTGKNFFAWMWSVPILLLFGAVIFTSCSKNDNNKATAQMYNISGSASGSQMVPAVNGNGTATITGTYNANTRQLNYTTNWSNLSGAPISGGFYYGATGVNGTISGSAWELPGGLTGTGSFTGTTTLTADQATQLLAGNWYYQLATAA
ncbi:MAG TPA: CHRD domain-containing protein, partial [Chitinophagaceae bacterium]|nr:CHRD domain-containing protein [Chitinophagaceae bacterium]